MKKETLFSTFYSFKGGVGSTLTLVNTAVELTRRGYFTMIWELDIETPGILHIPYFEKLTGKIKGGFVDIALEFARDDFKDINRQKLDGFLTFHPDNPNLILFPAGNPGDEKDYSQKLASIPWEEMIRVGKKWNFALQLFEFIRQHLLDTRPDFVLIDSPAGFTDIGGICCFTLPDVVFLVFNYAIRHMKGTGGIHRALKDAGWLKQIRDDKPLQSYLIASMIPMDRPDLLKTRKAQWLENHAPGFAANIEIPFNMEMAFNETVWPAEYPDHQFCRYYRQIADILLEERDHMKKRKTTAKRQ